MDIIRSSRSSHKLCLTPPLFQPTFALLLVLAFSQTPLLLPFLHQKLSLSNAVFLTYDYVLWGRKFRLLIYRFVEKAMQLYIYIYRKKSGDSPLLVALPTLFFCISLSFSVTNGREIGNRKKEEEAQRKGENHRRGKIYTHIYIYKLLSQETRQNSYV